MPQMIIVKILYIVGGFLVLLSLIAHLYVRVSLRPRHDRDLDNYYYEFKDRHPTYAKYTRWLQITLGGAAVGVLLLFLAMVF